MKSKKIKISVVVLLFIITIISCIDPIHPTNQYLQHLGTLVVASILFWDIKKMKLSLFAFSFVGIFILIHIIGARWIYSEVPYNVFFKDYLGINLELLFNSDRNHYDRFVHFIFGVLFIPCLFEIFKYKFKNYLIALSLAWFSVQTFSMLYEVFEWLLTVFMDSAEAKKYNGQQGDFWDAQKDMALALIGSSITSVIYYYKRKNID